MKILISTHYFESHRGGIELIAAQQFRAFAEGGHEVVWAAADVTPAPFIAGNSRAVPLRTFNFIEQRIGVPIPIPTPAALRQLRRELASADVLVLHECLYIANIFAFIVALFSGVPIIINQHAGVVPYRNTILRFAMRAANVFAARPMLARADKVVFESGVPKKFFEGIRYRSSPEVIFNGVDSSAFRGVQQHERVQLRAEFGLSDRAHLVLFVGRFVEKKGMGALRLMALLRPNYTWVFAGWGPLDPSGWKLENVRVFSGLSRERIAALYAISDIFVLPSVGEGFPLVIQEALASGLPVICGEETLIADPELAEHIRGVTVTTSDHERTARDFVATIDDVLTAEQAEEGLSERRRAFVLERYSWTNAARRYLEIASHLALAPALGTRSNAAGQGTSR